LQAIDICGKNSLNRSAIPSTIHFLQMVEDGRNPDLKNYPGEVRLSRSLRRHLAVKRPILANP
jgi:hypothetical protein